MEKELDTEDKRETVCVFNVMKAYTLRLPGVSLPKLSIRVYLQAG